VLRKLSQVQRVTACIDPIILDPVQSGWLDNDHATLPTAVADGFGRGWRSLKALGDVQEPGRVSHGPASDQDAFAAMFAK